MWQSVDHILATLTINYMFSKKVHLSLKSQITYNSNEYSNVRLHFYVTLIYNYRIWGNNSHPNEVIFILHPYRKHWQMLLIVPQSSVSVCIVAVTSSNLHSCSGSVSYVRPGQRNITSSTVIVSSHSVYTSCSIPSDWQPGILSPTLFKS